jgi:predicted dienelactone hydrolase
MFAKNAFIYLFCLFIVTPHLVAGVGIVHRDYFDATRQRTLKTAILYPAKTTTATEHGGNRVFIGFDASADAPVHSDKPLPLIMLVHGTSGNWRNLTWLGVPLVQQGAIVVTANHPGSTTGDASPASVIRMWQQPQDIQFLLDQILSSTFAAHVDTNQIAVVGSSLGGYTAMAVAGATLDFARYPEFCKTHNDNSTAYFRPALGSLDAAFYTNANQSFFDDRVKASVALVPGFVEVMRPKSIAALPTPVLIVGAGLDENVPPETHLKPILPFLPKTSRYVEISDATHFSFLQRCKPGAMAILAEDNETFVCLEKGRLTRAGIHQAVLREVLSFLKENGILRAD